MGQPAEAVVPAPEPEEPADALARALAIDVGVARALLGAGLSTPEQVRSAPDASLLDAGLAPEEVARIHAEPHAPAGAEDGTTMDKWMRSSRRVDKGRRKLRSTPGGSTEVMKRWIGGDDRALESWIKQSDENSPTLSPAPPQPEMAEGEELASTPAIPAAMGGTEALPAKLLEREETVVRWLTDLLDRVKNESFDPSSLLQEFQEAQRELFDERERRRVTEEELEHVKRGSIAVIKYVRTREAKAREELVEEKDAELQILRKKLEELAGRLNANQVGPTGGEGLVALEARLKGEYAAREEEILTREAELRRRVVALEGELRTARSEAESRRGTVEGMPSADEREKEIVRRENELRARFEEIRIRAEDIDRKREPLAYKERELGTREAELALKQKTLEAEARRLEQARANLPTGPAPSQESTKLEDRADELRKREEELRTREAFLSQRVQELEGLERKAAEKEADQMHAEAVEAVAAHTAKVRTGVRRLDDLLFGGLPPGSQVLVNGPAHTGKDLLGRFFLIEGLKQGQGALLVVTDRTYTILREEMQALLPNYNELERRGLVRYVDLYSRSLGVTEAEKGVKLLSSTDKGLLDQLPQAVNGFAAELKERAGGYRFLFESVSTVTAYLDSSQAFRVLQPLVGRRKLDGASGYYEIETGMHSEADLQTLEHMVDGSLNLKVDQLKTFLSVRGVTDVQSRAWVGYTFTKKSFSLGSFSLDHIR
jgi:KaiC/GvpD/RAD55 family RecA-like ATPase